MEGILTMTKWMERELTPGPMDRHMKEIGIWILEKDMVILLPLCLYNVYFGYVTKIFRKFENFLEHFLIS
jgi:hypothetical protein